MLCAKFEEEELREAVWDCEGDKSPGPDGINFRFLKTFGIFSPRMSKKLQMNSLRMELGREVVMLLSLHWYQKKRIPKV